MDWNKAADLFGVDLTTASLLGFIVYAFAQNCKKWTGRIGWRVVSLVLLLALVVALGVNAQKAGGIVINKTTIIPTLFLALFVAAVALTIGTVNSIVPDKRPPLLDFAAQGNQVVGSESPTLEMPALAPVIAKIRAPRQQSRFEQALHAFGAAWSKKDGGSNG